MLGQTFKTLLLSSSSSQAQAALARPRLLQQRRLLQSVKSPSRAQLSLLLQTRTLLQSPSLILQLPARHSPSIPCLLPRSPSRTHQQHWVVQLWRPLHPFQTDNLRQPLSQPGPQEVRMQGLRRQSGQTVWQSEFQQGFWLFVWPFFLSVIDGQLFVYLLVK